MLVQCEELGFVETEELLLFLPVELNFHGKSRDSCRKKKYIYIHIYDYMSMYLYMNVCDRKRRRRINAVVTQFNGG